MGWKELFRPRVSVVVLTVIIYIISQVIIQSGPCLEILLVSCPNANEFVYTIPYIFSSSCQKCGTIGAFSFDQFLVWILPAIILYIISSVVVYSYLSLRSRK